MLKAGDTTDYIIFLFCVCLKPSAIKFPVGTSGKEPTCRYRRSERRGFDPWVGKIQEEEEGRVTHSKILAWKILWTEEPGGLVRRVVKSQTQQKQLSTHTQ